MIIEGQEIMVIIQNPNFLAQVVTEGMRMSLDNYMNHLWMANILDPLVPAVAPALYHPMHNHWNFPQHFNPLLNMNQMFDLPFFPP